jgi:hypothetical protein
VCYPQEAIKVLFTLSGIRRKTDAALIDRAEASQVRAIAFQAAQPTDENSSQQQRLQLSRARAGSDVAFYREIRSVS